MTINDFLDISLKLKKLFKPDEKFLAEGDFDKTVLKQPCEIKISASDQANKQKLLELIIAEQQRLYDTVNEAFDNLRVKALGLMAGEIAAVTFLFSVMAKSHPFTHKPVPVYGVIFFGLGIGLLAFAFIMFLHVISSVHWTHPPDNRDISDIHDRFNDDPIRFLEYLKSEYIRAIDHCISKLNPRASRFMWGVYSLSLGIFTLLIVEFGSSIIKGV